MLAAHLREPLLPHRCLAQASAALLEHRPALILLCSLKFPILQASSTFSNVRLAPGPAAPPAEERANAGAGAGSSPLAPTTQIAPASDLQTRQLRLLPWQTGPAAPPGDGQASGDEAAARRASGAVTSAREGAVQVQRRARLAAPGTAGEASAPNSNGSTDPSAGNAARMPLPLWRQRPDYRPGALLTLQDVDLAALDGGSSSDEAPSPGAGAAAALSAASSPSDSDAEQAGGDGGSAGAGAPKRRRNFGRKAGPMSEERKAAISRALQSKGAKSEEHKRWAGHGGRRQAAQHECFSSPPCSDRTLAAPLCGMLALLLGC